LNLIRDLYNRFRDLIHEVLKFGTVGGVGALLQFIIQDIAHAKYGMSEAGGQAVGIGVGVFLTFFGNRYWTYADRRSHGKAFYRETAQFLFWCFAGLGIQEGLLWVFTSGIHHHHDSLAYYDAVTAVGIAVATLFRLWAYRTFVFKSVEPSGEAMEELYPESAR
jgi:putative flippase GtrA